MNKKTQLVLQEIAQERENQDAKWGEQNHPILPVGYPPCLTFQDLYNIPTADHARRRVERGIEMGNLTYMDILLEEVCEVVEERQADKIREELVQVAAVAVAMIEALDRNGYQYQ